MIRRLLDIFGASVGLLMVSPLLLGVALGILLLDGSPIFYRQGRAGLGGREFALLKFRSMRLNQRPVNRRSEVLEDDPLVTPFGKWMRRFKVDEIPQLLNVLLGDMSLVGPRPALPEQAAEYTAFERRRLEVRPGMTGWAQVNGNIEIPWSDRILLDVWYIDHRSLWLDLRILMRTLAVVFLGEQPNMAALKEAHGYADRLSGRG